jgi:hypothetical protein
MRVFKKGATRDNDQDKIDPEGFLSPIVLESFCEYMMKHRKTADGVRDSDNWQHLFGEKHLDVCMKSLSRHYLDLWKFHRGYKGRDTILDACNGILFNTMAYMFKILKDK